VVRHKAIDGVGSVGSGGEGSRAEGIVPEEMGRMDGDRDRTGGAEADVKAKQGGDIFQFQVEDNAFGSHRRANV
jgi:hypothetical protein